MLVGDMVRRNARRYPDKTALVFKDARYTFQELHQRTNSLAQALLGLGLSRGDRVAVLADNSSQYMELYFAAAKGGMVLAPVNTNLPGPELSYIINDSQASVLVLGENYGDVVREIRPELTGVEHFVVIGPGDGALKGYEELVQSCPPTEPEVELDEGDLFCLLYTSGTTGLPKGVMIKHRYATPCAVDWVIAHGTKTEDVMLHDMPCYHSGFLYSMTPYAYLGCTHVILERFDPGAALQAIDREKVTACVLVVPMLMSVLEHPDLGKYDLSSLRLIKHAGAPMPLPLLERATEVFGPIISAGYGSTESGGIVTYLGPEDLFCSPEEKAKRAASCGRETTNAEIRLVDDEGREVSPGKAGEIILRWDGVTPGYWGLSQATAETVKGDYLYTGDLATRDEQGYIYILDRKKDTITVGGVTVNSREVEDVVYHHPAVSEAAVIGIPDSSTGEAVKAIVVLKEGHGATEAEIIDFCGQSLKKEAIPRWVAFADYLPRTPSGKVLKRELRRRHG
jgi:acyl-CoA synthetase (AMP-forming)/AMP-acid ligase II